VEWRHERRRRGVVVLSPKLSYERVLTFPCLIVSVRDWLGMRCRTIREVDDLLGRLMLWY
jgi:hypothetical protein